LLTPLTRASDELRTGAMATIVTLGQTDTSQPPSRNATP
jgi:hypothetical protein